MNILITGNLGFIGTHLQAALKKRGHTTFGFDARHPSLIDVRKYHLIKKVAGMMKQKPDIIVHLAANTSSKIAEEKPRDDFTINTVGTINVLELARELGAGVIYPSTVKVAEDKGGRRSPYGLSKYIAEELCIEWRNTFNVAAIVNRFGNLYGPGGDHFFANTFVKKAAEGQPIEIWGNGTAMRDLLWIDDLIELLVDQVENFHLYDEAFIKSDLRYLEAGGGRKNMVSVNEILKVCDDYFPGTLDRVTYKKELKGDKEMLYTHNDMNRINGWKPTTKVSEGLAKLAKHYG